MKILETQAAVLSNYEVLQHLEDMQARYERQSQRRKPKSLEGVVKILRQYLEKRTGASAPDLRIDKGNFRAVFDSLSPFNLTKAELLMILNLRPHGTEMLEPIIEEKDTRLSEDDQKYIIKVILDFLGDDRTNQASGDGAEG